MIRSACSSNRQCETCRRLGVGTRGLSQQEPLLPAPAVPLAANPRWSGELSTAFLSLTNEYPGGTSRFHFRQTTVHHSRRPLQVVCWQFPFPETTPVEFPVDLLGSVRSRVPTDENKCEQSHSSSQSTLLFRSRAIRSLLYHQQSPIDFSLLDSTGQSDFLAIISLSLANQGPGRNQPQWVVKFRR